MEGCFTKQADQLADVVRRCLAGYVNFVEVPLEGIFDHLSTGTLWSKDAGGLLDLSAGLLVQLQREHRALRFLREASRSRAETDSGIVRDAVDAGVFDLKGNGSNRYVTPETLFSLSRALGCGQSLARRTLYRVAVLALAPDYYRLFLHGERSENVSVTATHWAALVANLRAMDELPSLPERLGLAMQVSDPEREYEVLDVLGHEILTAGSDRRLILHVQYAGYTAPTCTGLDETLAAVSVAREYLIDFELEDWIKGPDDESDDDYQ
ncbi:hypothetical protein J8273_4057 [Carpediemonas membranifera]|nr:hypothetical protein J8273_6952 [Carpediemonas membranifera]KAG9392055.1 hypothetical protein J8273_6646 [Carpediemonas membranifera]KAG9394410.1 hypothetical protein J8273_4057 [Carpediemonas membranifera]|eukprot:KAG9390712.1 hypothetical protein J8273_6952 [Carpediemonas membranifera]